MFAHWTTVTWKQTKKFLHSITMMQQGGQPMLVLSQNTKRETGRKAQTSNIQVWPNVLQNFFLFLVGCQSCRINRQNHFGTKGNA
jgi:hypothetical protein